jgi:hypothetical protein
MAIYDKAKILSLFNSGKKHREIAAEIGCSVRTVEYHCCPASKDSVQRRNRKRYLAKTRSALKHKLYQFVWKTRGKGMPPTLGEVSAKLGERPVCYLTGTSINLHNSSAYSLDHVIPITRDGTCDIANLGLARTDINQAKLNKTPAEFLAMCVEVLRHNGYKIEPPNTSQTTLSCPEAFTNKQTPNRPFGTPTGLLVT